MFGWVEISLLSAAFLLLLFRVLPYFRSYRPLFGAGGKLFIPSGYKGQELPLVVMLHGCTQSPDDFAAGTGMNGLAEEQSFLVAYPAQARSANVSKCWNWFNVANQQRDQGEPSLIAGITGQIMRDFAVQPGRVYIAGLSAGGATAAIMGTAYPELYAAVGAHSGLACGAASDMTSAMAAMKYGSTAPTTGKSNGSGRVIPTIVFHGDSDTTVNIVNGDQVIAQSRGAAHLRASVIEGEAAGGIGYTRTIQSDDRGRPILEEWVLHRAGHAWSGGSAAGSFTEPRGPDASREMIRFSFNTQHLFRRRHRPAPPSALMLRQSVGNVRGVKKYASNDGNLPFATSAWCGGPNNAGNGDPISMFDEPFKTVIGKFRVRQWCFIKSTLAR
jgi:poly(hydroxyalkanoate) depolymerase family esterase